MGSSGIIHEIKPEDFSHVARKATSDSFAKAIKSNIIVVYKEGNNLIERQPNGVKVTIQRLKHEKRTFANKFKLK